MKILQTSYLLIQWLCTIVFMLNRVYGSAELGSYGSHNGDVLRFQTVVEFNTEMVLPVLRRIW